MTRLWIIVGGLAGFLGVALGAYADHGVKDAHAMKILETASQYSVLHGLALLAVAALGRTRPSVILALSGLAFTGGIVLFTGGIVSTALTVDQMFRPITPYGGIAYMAGWLLLAVYGMFVRRD